MNKDRTNVLLDKDVMISLKNMARLEEKSITMIVREAITQYLSRNASKNEWKIIGIGESNIHNLSINKKRYVKDLKKT